MKRVSVLGSTGSIGRQALDVIAAHPDELQLYGIAAHRSTDALVEQAKTYRPAVVACETAFDASLLPRGTRALFGFDAVETLARDTAQDVVVNGVSGFAALSSVLASLNSGLVVALANKESIVCGHTLIDAALHNGGCVIPVDSEQSAIDQCLACGRVSEVDKVILTASGGPFWRLSRAEAERVSPAQALAHPTWRMGKKITIDSATLFNKGLEIMEAAYLFRLDADRVDVVIHPQSIVHSMVAYRDGTVIANMSKPDMRLPIQYAIFERARVSSLCAPLRLCLEQSLSFHAVDLSRFGSVRMAYECLRAGGSYPIAYNGANEAAVQAFLDGRIGFMDIERVVDYTLQKHTPAQPSAYEQILALDADARTAAWEAVMQIGKADGTF